MHTLSKLRGDMIMKKILTIMLILMISLFVLGGCSQAPSEQSASQEQNTKKQAPIQEQKPADSGIPPPPALPNE